MDKKHSHRKSKCGLPNTPRVSDKIMEYYEKFGQDRDLEKFMRLYSPASSQDSQKTQRVCGASIEVDSCCMSTQSHESVASISSCDALAKMPSRPLSVCCAVNSKSLPNIDVQGQELHEENFPAKDVIIDINIEMEGDSKKIFSASSENIQTPKKVLRDNKTQTPESVAKSHRRLEWDSLGDVGYKRSMSTSNISILERSLLKEFFKECTVTSEPCTSRQATEHERHQKQIQHKIVKCIKNTEIEHSTPPLACSTLVEGHREKSTTEEAKPKMITQSTSSTSLQKKLEKYAQTSLFKPPSVHSQEIQCTMSSSNSIIEGTATPSSFEYYSSRSSKSSEYVAESNSRRQANPSEHPFITSITDLLMKRKVLCEKNHQNRSQLANIRELQTRFQAALEENKENHSHSTIASSTTTSFSLTKQAPELDLGIQLICSLIDAKSVNGKHKKQLIRDIVKRITRLEVGASSHSTNSSGGATTSNSNESSGIKHSNIYDTIHSNSNKALSGVLNDMLVTSESGISPIPLAVYSGGSKETPSTSTSNTISKPIKKYDELNRLEEEPPPKGSKENNRKLINVTKAKTNKETHSDVIIAHQIKAGNAKVETLRSTLSELNQATKSVENKTNRSTQTSKTSTSSDGTRSKTSTKSSSESSSSTTQDMTTQKFLVAPNDLNNSNTDAEQPTMREWLNPLTQSEIEYEEKKREEIKKKSTVQQAELRREKHLKKSSKNDCGRVQQLNWIENEIHRLECLKHLLLKDETTTTTTTERTTSTEWVARKENSIKNSTQTDKLYDTVYSDKSSVLSESAELLVKEIEVILEESNEDVINVRDNLKRTKERKKEIQIIHENPNSKKNHKFRTMKETTTINEEQLLTDKHSEIQIHPRQQREKIDTPSTENSQESESLKDLVQQKKRDFMEAYKTKKQNHYAALKQQQKEQFESLKIQKKANDKCTQPPTTDSVHYSVPHTMTRKYNTNELPYTYTQNPLPLTPEDVHTTTPSSAHVISSTSVSIQQTNCLNIPSNKNEKNQSSTTTSTTKTTSTTSSSTSMFCISSDVSVPMGSQLTSSTPTTTHHYDDVAAAVLGVAVQTSDSIIRTRPIYGPQTVPFLHTKRLASHFRPCATTSSSTACIQVKPKSIAYVIEFDNSPSSNSISNLNLNMNSDKMNSVTESTKPPTIESSNSYIANNIKALLPSEPQWTLQDYLEKAKPQFLQHSKERKAILNQLQSMRQARDLKLREIVDNTSFNSLERRLQYLPPPPIQKVRILNTKEMKALTNKRFVNLPEVVARKERVKEEQYRRSNRILRDIFNRRLQKSVLGGKLSLNHSKTVI